MNNIPSDIIKQIEDEAEKQAHALINPIWSGRLYTTDAVISFIEGAKFALSLSPSSGEGDLLQQLKRVCFSAWYAAANAYKMYPDSKHTFSDYWDLLGKNECEKLLNSEQSVQ